MRQYGKVYTFSREGFSRAIFADSWKSALVEFNRMYNDRMNENK